MHIIENLSDHFTLSLCLSPSLSLVIEWIISCQGPWNHTPNPELPFLLASKIFIRTIRSSDKASTKGWGACGREGMVCQQDVCSATLYTKTCPHQSETQQLPSLPPVRPGCQGKVARCQLTPSPQPLSQQALLCPRPWAGGVGHTARTVGGGGHKGKLVVAQANSQKPLCSKERSHFSRSAHKVTEKHRTLGLWF